MLSAQDTVLISLDSNLARISFDSAIYIREAILDENYYRITDRTVQGKLLNSIQYS